MKIIISAGGTGGHLYPALAFTKYIKSKHPSVEFLFVGTKDRLEATVVPQHNYRYVGLNVKGLVGNPLQKGYKAMLFLKSIATSKRIIKDFKPDIVIGFGGYPSASIVKAAQMLGVKTMIHEQNSIIGLTNKILIKKVDAIICCYQKAYDVLPKEKTYLCGNPRESMIDIQKNEATLKQFNLNHQQPIVLIFMGSLGSAIMNKTIVDVLNACQDKPYQVVYVTGKSYYEEFSKHQFSNNIHVVPYVEDMPALMIHCDVIVSRAGASSLAEICALAVPSILVPSPYVASNHQEYNARELVEQNCATMILEKDFNQYRCIEEIDKILNEPFIVESYLINMKKRAKLDACQNMYQVMMELIGD